MNILYVTDRNGMIVLNQDTAILEKGSKFISEVARFYSGQRKVEDIHSVDDISRITKPVALISWILTYSAMDFVLCHEYAHIILGYSLSIDKRLNEVKADVLAFNILLNHNEEYKDLIHFRVIAPIFLFYFLFILESIQGLSVPISHPHSYIRVKCLYNASKIILRDQDEYLKAFGKLFLMATYLFTNSVKHIMPGKDMLRFLISLDESYLKDFNFILVPINRGPEIYGIDFERSNKLNIKDIPDID